MMRPALCGSGAYLTDRSPPRARKWRVKLGQSTIERGIFLSGTFRPISQPPFFVGKMRYKYEARGLAWNSLQLSSDSMQDDQTLY